MRTIAFNKPRLRECFVVEVVEPRTVFLLNEYRHFVFEGEIYPVLVQLLQGQRSLAEILSALAQKFSIQDIYAAIYRMAGSHCLVDSDGTPLPEHAAFWDNLGAETDAAEVGQRLAQTTFSIRTVGDVSSAEMEKALRQSGLRVEPDGDLLVVITDDYLREELAEIDHQARANARPWVLVKPIGTIAWVGPLFRPNKTACWHCLEQRLRSNRQVERFIRARSKDPIATSKTRVDSIERAGALLTALELAKSIARPSKSGLENKIFTLDLQFYQVEEHVLVRRPQCKACGQAIQVGAPRPVTLTSRKKQRAVAGERTVGPEEVFRRYQYHISPITGAVSSLIARDLHDHRVIHNYVTGHYFPLFTDDTTQLQVNQIARSGGKGATESQAKASALAEALERYSGISWGDEYKIRGSFASLQPEAIPMRDVLLFSKEQYRTHRDWNANPVNQRHYVPDPLDDGKEISWTPLWSLSHNRTRYLPTAFCFYGHVDHGLSFCRCDSNGCAAGSTPEEAIMQGFLELAERDALAIWWYNRLRRPAVDVSTFNLSYWEKMRPYYAGELKRDLNVIDITSDLGIPTFVAVSRRLDQAKEDIIIGIGCHLEPRAALMQALVEANQSVPLLHYVTRGGARLERFFARDILEWLKIATYENQPYVVPDAAAVPRKYTDYPRLSSDDVLQDVLTCVDIAKARGLEVLALEQTRPDIGMPVMRVVVPGLRHFWRRLAPGRLYEVPVQMGSLQKPLTEAEMNPISFFI